MNVKPVLPHFLSVILIIGIGIAFCLPQFQGKMWHAGDTDASAQKTQEIRLHQEKTGEKSYWSNSMFGGMPQGLMLIGRDHNTLQSLRPAFRAFLRSPAGMFIRCMILGYLALILLGINPWLSLLGALLFGLTTNYVVLFAAGHSNKVLVLSLSPVVLASLFSIFRGRPWLGSAVLAAAISLSIYENHIQMVYYLALMVLPLGCILLWKDTQSQGNVSWDKVLLIAAALALGALSNVSQLSASQQVSKSTMRGAPVLSSGAAQDGSSSSVDGLDWAYATQWSNGIPDLMSLLVPRFVGGSSAEEVPPTTELARRMQMNGVQPGKDGNYKVGLYWGPMPFNGGPYYAGTVLVLLYILSWFCIPRHISTGFGIGILLCMLLSMGSHASFFNRPLFDFLPLFNKFRAPNSAVAVMPFFLILPAIWGLHNLLKYQSWNEQKKLILKSAGICVTGYALIYLIAPSLLSFIGPKEVTFAEDIQKLFVQDRTDLLRSDTLRCLLFLVLSAGTLLLLGLGKSKSYVPILLCVIGLIDIWGVNRRYFDDSGFSPNREASDRFDPRPVDEQIFQLERRGRGYYRVFDLSIDVFNSASTSYHHNTIGGYSPKKPQRYQDLIERYISKGNTGILNMLNTKYVIQKDGRLQTNPGAYGNCWFVSQITDVKTPDEEIAVLGSTDLNTTAVILKSEFVKELDGFSVGDGTGSIELTSYTPNRLVYSTDVTSEQLAVFSEIWMEDGWYATIDGVEAPIIRVNYDFRGLKIPAGSKEVVFSYEPRMSLAYINLICSLLIFGGLFFGGYRLWKEQSILAETSPKVAPQSLSKTKKKITKATQSKKASIKSKRGKKK